MIEINMQMPKKCGLCPCFHFENPMYCQAVKADKNKKIVAPYGAPRPEWCPMKEQEAKQVIKQAYHVMMNRDYENPVEVTRYDWLCPTCKSLLCRDIDVIDDNYHFCKVCGQKVKWE